MDKELKPCPFCGGPPEYDCIQGEEDEFEPFWAIGCCDAHVAADDRDQAVQAWNTRPNEDRLTAKNERLRSALKAHDKYMSDQFTDPNSSAIHPKAAANWKSVRTALSEEASK